MTEQGSILELHFDDVYDFETLPDGEEVQLRIARAEIYRKEGGTRSNLHVIFEDPSNERVQDIHVFMGLPTADDDVKLANKMKLRIKAFYEAAGIDMSGPIDLDNLVGETLYAVVGEQEEPGYGRQNFIRSFSVPR
jgi:hypothetical protein